MVREESHLDDMRAAIRGDFERLERRLGAQELMQVGEDEPPDEPADTEQAEQADEDELSEPLAEQPGRSWLDRMLGR